MRPYLVIVFFLSGTVFARYYEKTRFDRSVYDEHKSRNIENNSEKRWSFTDDVTQFVAYKSKKENDCYLENIKQNQNILHKKRQLKVLYASTVLTKLEAWRLAGGRIVDFCNGRSIILLQTTRPVSGRTPDPFLNEIPVDENDISSRRVADVVLMPLISPTRRQIQLEQREQLNEQFNRIRQRRQTSQFRGKFRGQTQSQYLHVGNGEQKDGRAEAEATQQSSRAVVSGSRGMGQAQSMSSSGTGCEDCPGYPGYPTIEGVPATDGDRYVQRPAIPGVTRPGTGVTPEGVPYPGGVIPGRPISYPGGVIPERVGTYPGVLPGIRPGIYPGDIQPGTARPGVVEGAYPEGVQPGTIRPGGDGIYPGSIQPGVIRPGGDGTYPTAVQPGVIRPGGDGVYPGSIQPGTVRPGADGVYPGAVQPGTVIPESRPGITMTTGGDGVYPGGIRPGVVRPGSDGTYPGSVRPGIPPVTPGVDGTYPPGTLIAGHPRPYPGVQPGGVPSGILTTGVDTGIGTYPGGIQPGVQPGVYPSGGVTTSITTATAGVGTYPIGIAPGVSLPGGALPTGISGTYPGIYPGGVRPSIAPGTGGIEMYPSGVVPGRVISQDMYPPGVQQPGVSYPGIAPGILAPGGGITYPASTRGQVPGVATTTGSTAGTQVITYPGDRAADGRLIYPGSVQPGRIPDGTSGAPGTQVVYPGADVYPGGVGTVPIAYPGSRIVYPSGAQQVTSPAGTLYPGQVVYPSGTGQVAGYPGGLYPGAGIPGTGVPGGAIIPGRIQYPVGTTGDQAVPGGTGITGQYPGQYPGGLDGRGVGIGPVKPPGTGGIGDTAPQYLQTGAGGGPATDDGAESQASSSVQQVDSGTQASASAQGKYGRGTAQSQVTGTYSGSGSFSAQAGTSDADKSAQAEISGGKEGATSNAQGAAGYGKSQAQVQLDPDSGATSTGAQSSGWNHGTNSQVQASSKGGMADAQANGEGSTSSQAQIGFQPYLKNEENEKVERRATPFRGSGTASAQSGTHRGQSQSQLQGSFQYGITYTGAAQAGSGSGAASSRKPFNFSVTDTELFKPFKPLNALEKPANVSGALEPNSSGSSSDNENGQNRERGLQSSSTSRQTVVVGSKDNPGESAVDRKVSSTARPHTDDAMYDDYDDDEYANEDDYDATTMSPLPSSSTRSFTRQRDKTDRIAQRQSSMAQMTQVVKGNQYDVHVSQDSNAPRTGEVLQPGQSLQGYTVPPGFRGRVTSISGTETVAQGDGKSQSQTVSLVPRSSNGTQSAPGITETRSLQTNHERHVDRHTSKDKSQGTSTDRPSAGRGASSDKHHARPTTTSIAMKPSYYTVTNSVAGKMNGSNASRKYEHRYYTKSSTCGYFTFSCNVVYGSNGRTKICKPKVPTHPDGTPMRC